MKNPKRINICKSGNDYVIYIDGISHLKVMIVTPEQLEQIILLGQRVLQNKE